jgi:acyl-[acyl-carrier-protein]-phospholipid O-acyltransferase / long-chain-fatty-acid--[acyl-carrier-protein] ligase
MRTFLKYLVRMLYRFRSFNEESLKTPGPVLLVPNHVSWFDWIFVGVCLEEDWKFVTSRTTAQLSWVHRLIMINRYTFPIDLESPYAAKHMAEFLEKGGRLVLFAEGRISITGTLMKFFEGTGFLMHRTNAKIIPCYVRGADRIPFVRHQGWTRWFPQVTAHFGPVLTPPKFDHGSTGQTRHDLTTWFRDRFLEHELRVEMEYGPESALEAVAEMGRLRPGQVALDDINRKPVKYRRLMMGVDLLSSAWTKLGDSQPAGERIGVLLPNVSATPVTVLSLWAAGKVPAILNFSSGSPVMLACAQLAGLKKIITSQAFLERANLDITLLREAGLEFLFLEKVRESLPGTRKLMALIRQIFMPKCAVRHYPNQRDTAVILFTSGSEGTPKGVELTHANLMSNIRQMLAVIDLEDKDSIFNALPLFHSFGLTVGTLLPLSRGIFTFLYPSPLHFRVIPEVVYERAPTVMLSTNTFLNGYARKAHPYDFRSVRYLFAGAEKVQEATFNYWSRQFGIRILEGYGVTECSPCVSVNTPMESRVGTAGRFMPGVEHRLEPVEGVAEGGRLFIRGPNVMRGYLNPEANAQFQSLGGWYDTGDIVQVDEGGFVRILGRMKRFAKVGGEMVSLAAVEDALAGAFDHYGMRTEIAVLARPDDEKGEALIAVTNEPRLKLEEIRQVIRAKGLTNLAAPREIKVIREIPKMGTGKVNHRELAQMVLNGEG